MNPLLWLGQAVMLAFGAVAALWLSCLLVLMGVLAVGDWWDARGMR